jgi:hypothetical protein
MEQRHSILPEHLARGLSVSDIRLAAHDQFAGWGLYDNAAVCLTCKTYHLIPKAEQITFEPWSDWLTKHDQHLNIILKESELGKLGIQVSGWRHNADVKVAYVASAEYTITLTGLASDTNVLTGREGTGLSNASNKYLDVLISALVTTGTTPTASRQIEFYVVGALDDTPTYPSVFDGTDSAETLPGYGVKAAVCRMAGFSTTTNTSDAGYPLGPTGVRGLFGGDGLPVAHVPFIIHNTGVNLNVTAANHFVKHTQVYRTVV